MKTLADFKRKVQVGVFVHAYNHPFKKDFGVREIKHTQSNSFALETFQPDKEQPVLSWCEYPKASDIEFEGDNIAHIYWGEGDKREKVLTYTFNKQM